MLVSMRLKRAGVGAGGIASNGSPAQSHRVAPAAHLKSQMDRAQRASRAVSSLNQLAKRQEDVDGKIAQLEADVARLKKQLEEMRIKALICSGSKLRLD
ncbi:hypothetical protein HK105_201548 [Polyrhizophydium stewartii]|uniref:Uncharacterized protein n=1 Tax=Polyrhizophydium stewartii TaxID=2732419 RepID=A0ABR4NGP9_9FUNG